MSVRPSLVCAGSMPFVQFCDISNLAGQFRISTLKKRFLGLVKSGSRDNVRVVEVPQSDPSISVVAVSGREDPFPVFLYDVSSKNELVKYSRHAGPVYGLQAIPPTPTSSARLLSAGGFSEQRIIVTDSEDGSQLASLPDPPVSSYRLFYSPELHPSLFVGGKAGTVSRYDLETNSKTGSFVGHSDQWNVLGLSADVTTNVLFSASNDKTVRIWSLSDVQFVGILSLSHRGVSCYYAEDLHLLMVGLIDGIVEFWDPRQTSGRLGSFVPSTKCVYEIDRISESVFVSGSERSVALWDCRSKEVTHASSLPGTVSGLCTLIPREIDEASEEEGEDG